MERKNYDYSLKNIPLPSKDAYKKRLVEKVEIFIKRMRWKAYFFDQNEENNDENKENPRSNINNYGFKSRNCPKQNKHLDKFEDDLLLMIKNIEFRNVNDTFQNKLQNDIREINRNPKTITFADKSRNLYEIEKEEYNKLLMENITKTYKKSNTNVLHEINKEAKEIAKTINIGDKAEYLAKQQAFITLKDHKETFENNPTCRLINPAKSEIGLVSKQILENINNTLRNKLKVNQWRNTSSVIEWFNNIQDKQEYSFTIFDIQEFYPSISENLLDEAILFAKQHTNIQVKDLNIIKHARKSLLFDKDCPWVKRGNQGTFDVTMGCYDGAEVCELVGLLILSKLSTKFRKEDVGLYRDDGLAVFKNISGPQSEKHKKEICKEFKDLGLKITIQCNLKVVNFLDVTLDLNTGIHYPYKKPNDEIVYINKMSNHPPGITKQLPQSISRRLSTLSSNEEVFNRSKQIYENAIKKSGYDEKLTYTNADTQRATGRRNRRRNILWFNPPFSKNVVTNIGRKFLNLLTTHFPKNHRYHKIFNRNNIKISYSCMNNMESKIKSHNRKILYQTENNEGTGCNCIIAESCPLDGKCLEKCMVYQSTVTTLDNKVEKAYRGATEGTFKKRYATHTQSFNVEKYKTSTKLSKYIWELKRDNRQFTLRWENIKSARPYQNGSRRCDLCLTEKLLIIDGDDNKLLNKRSELISKCRHENKYYLMNYKTPIK